jgi:hypothetical protein
MNAWLLLVNTFTHVHSYFMELFLLNLRSQDIKKKYFSHTAYIELQQTAQPSIFHLEKQPDGGNNDKSGEREFLR